jgi:hypothetical protein
VTFEDSSPRRPLARRLTITTLGAIVVIAAIAIGVALRSSSPPLPTLNASYKCVPGSLIPQLKPGQSGTLTSSYGGFTATFRATMPAKTPANALIEGMPLKGTLTMTEGGRSWTLPGPANTKDSQINALCVVAFHRERDPGVMIEGFTGGAHCCEVPVIYLYDKTQNDYAKVVDMSPSNYKDPHAFNDNEGFIPKVAGNQVLLETQDGTFAYAFGCYACSESPIVLDSVDATGLTDVTGQHHSLVTADAAAIWKNALASVKAEGEANPAVFPAPFGFLAPWVADECVLGRGSSAWSEIERLDSEGKLSDALYYKETLKHGSFVTSLYTFLLADDYCTGQI